MRPYSQHELEILLNWDGLHCRPPFRNSTEERQHYARYVEKMLWRYLTPDDWRRLSEIIDTLRVPEKLRSTTKFLIPRHIPPNSGGTWKNSPAARPSRRRGK